MITDPTMIDMINAGTLYRFPSSSANRNAIFLIGGIDRSPAR